IWVHPEGIASVFKDGKFTPEAQRVLDRKAALLAVQPLRMNPGAPPPPPVNAGYAGYTFGYNRPLLAERVHDILTAVAFAQQYKDQVSTLHLAGFGKCGPWVALARGLCGTAIARTAVDANQFNFHQIKNMNDEMMLPGAVRYGDLATLAALAAPHELLVHNAKGLDSPWRLDGVYRASGHAAKLRRDDRLWSTAEVVEWLLR
ncbi:MAG: hypothetical protein NZO58_02770, partial [Gemmataceae bacterium]|nr:hypothetical protein [Gemmataceae bacterium]